MGNGVLLWLAVNAASGAVPSSHDIHVSYGRLVVDAGGMTLRLRMFQDDLSRALAGWAKRDTVDLTDRGTADSIAVGYLRERIELLANETRLVGRLVGGGADDKMWWYEIRYPLGGQVRPFTITQRVMFELFTDQQNLLKVVTTKRETNLYFTVAEPGPVTITP